MQNYIEAVQKSIEEFDKPAQKEKKNLTEEKDKILET